MNPLIAIKKEIQPLISRLIDKSSDGTMRVWIELCNGYTLSVIAGRGTYSGGEDSYEVAAFETISSDGKWVQLDGRSDVLANQSIVDINQHLIDLTEMETAPSKKWIDEFNELGKDRPNVWQLCHGVANEKP